MKNAPLKHRFAAVAVDAVIFGITDGKLKVLIDTVDRPPHYTNMEGFPGGIIDSEDTADTAVARHLKAKSGLEKLYLEQLYTFSEIERDKRSRVISVAYLGLIRPEIIQGYTHKTARWCEVSKLPPLAYDHNDMIEVALKRLRGKLSYTNIAQFLLPKNFTLTELQEVYEVIHGTTFDKRNFRKKIHTLGIVVDSGKKQTGVQNRPASLYVFRDTDVSEIPLVV